MRYRAEIDGLRALAVVPVILFHAGWKLFDGGYVGVDVFFVISGYLITTILIEDLENKRLSIISFYERRARRILPALFLVMLVCIPFAWIWMIPSQMKDFSQSFVATSLFTSNILFWLESGYFDADSKEKPLLHTWSLAVEEQYYIIFPIFLLIAWRFGKNRVLSMIVVMAVISLLLSEWGWRNKPIANFYLAPMRAWELLAGSTAAFILHKYKLQKNNFLGLFGLLVILFSIFIYDETTPFPSIYTLVPVLGVVLIILYGDKDTYVARLLSIRAFVGIGLISYSLYLWHQPLFAFAKVRIYEPSELIFIVLSFVSIILAYLTWKYVETPFRNGRIKVTNKFYLLALLLVFISSFIMFGIIGHISDGYRTVSNSRVKLAEVGKRIEPNYGISKLCNGKLTLSKNCSPSDMPQVLLWGDSFAMHLYQGIVASNASLKIHQVTKSSCSPILDLSRFSILANKGHDWASECIDFNDKVFEWLLNNNQVEFVILSSPFGWVGRDKMIDKDGVIYKPNIKTVLNKFAKTIKRINSAGVGVVVVSPTPKSGKNIGHCLIKKYLFDNQINCNFYHSELNHQNEFIKKLSLLSPVYWLHKDICTEGICFAEMNNIFIYRDAGHLSKEGSSFLGNKYNWYDKMRTLALSGLKTK
jgi:peptidoglycan/LPS O-acetylase OafA/YrhL